MQQITVPLADEDTENGVPRLYAMLAEKWAITDYALYVRQGVFTVLGVALGALAPEQAIDLYMEACERSVAGDLSDADSFAARLGRLHAGFIEGFNEARKYLPEHAQEWLADI